MDRRNKLIQKEGPSSLLSATWLINLQPQAYNYLGVDVSFSFNLDSMKYVTDYSHHQKLLLYLFMILNSAWR